MRRFQFLGMCVFLSLLFHSCSSKDLKREDVIELVNSQDACDRIKGFLAVGNLMDTSLYPLFFKDMQDRHITHCTKYYGKTVLWAKIESLRKITKVEPELPYDFMNPNPAILMQYKDLMIK